MQYWWHHKTQHAPFGLSVSLLLGFCGLAAVGIWHFWPQQPLAVNDILLPEATVTRTSPMAVEAAYRAEMAEVVALLDKPDANMAVEVEKRLLRVRVPREKLDAHLSAVLAWNRLDKSAPTELAAKAKLILNTLLQ